MKKWKPPMKGVVKVKPGRRVIWLARPSSMSVGFATMAVVAIVLGLIAAGVPIVPLVWYNLKPSVTANLARMLHEPVASQANIDSRLRQSFGKPIDTWQPPLDKSLPLGGWMKIPAIGVNTAITEAASDNYETALKQGVWRVPDFGTPLKRVLPTILVAHRFGYLSWSNEYRHVHSFYNLPKLKVGDTVEIDWGQRKYTYVIYKTDQGTQITDYSADLILYTCQYLESDQRIFEYARLVK